MGITKKMTADTKRAKNEMYKHFQLITKNPTPENKANFDRAHAEYKGAMMTEKNNVK